MKAVVYNSIEQLNNISVSRRQNALVCEQKLGGIYMRKINVMDGVIFDSFTGNASVIKRYPQEARSLAIANDGKVDAKIDLGDC